jgi:hypothetical protein
MQNPLERKLKQKKKREKREIGYTATSHLANVSLLPNGIVITTAEITENDLFL